MENGAFAPKKMENITENGAFAPKRKENIMDNGAFASKKKGKYYGKWSICSFGAIAPFSVFKILLNFFHDFFQCYLKIEHDIMI